MTDQLLWQLLGFGCLPAWLLAGLVDYRAHRSSDIAHTSGPRESALHLAQALQVGVPVLAVLFLELNVLTLALIAGCTLLHAVTAYWDLSYTTGRRYIGPGEQMAHAFLITLPIFALALLTLLWWPDAASGPGPAGHPTPARALQWRSDPFHPGIIAGVLGTALVFGLLPAIAELRQSLRVDRARRE